MVRIPDYDQQIKNIAAPTPEPGIKPMPMVSGGSIYVGKNYINPRAYSAMYDGISNMIGSFSELYLGMKKLKFEQTKFEFDIEMENRKLQGEVDSLTSPFDRPASSMGFGD